MNRRFALAALFAVLAPACKTPDAPDGTVTVEQHPEYAAYRPVVIATLPVKAGRSDVREPLRQAAYEMLFHKKYSPLSLRSVDAHVDQQGEFAARDMNWDATLRIVVDEWRGIAGSRVAADAHARLVYRTGEELWRVTVKGQPLEVTAAAGDVRHEDAAAELARILIARLPERPPLPE